MKLGGSIMAADLLDLRLAIETSETAGVDLFHVDIMDGHYVPNLTFGVNMVDAIRRASKRHINVHLMVSNPEQYIDELAHAGADSVCFHADATTCPIRLLQRIRQRGMQPGLAVSPHVAPAELEYLLEHVDMLIVMTVEPGFAGQKMLPAALDKIPIFRQMASKLNRHLIIAVDGGVNFETITKVLAYEPDIIICASLIYSSRDIAGTVRRIKELMAKSRSL